MASLDTLLSIIDDMESDARIALASGDMELHMKYGAYYHRMCALCVTLYGVDPRPTE